VARPLYDQELARRGLTPGQKVPEPVAADHAEFDDAELADESFDEDEEIEEMELEADDGPAPAWLEDAACACSFLVRTATSDLPEAAKARAILRDSRIPSYATVSQEEQAKPNAAPVFALRLMVPAGLELHAVSVLDQHLFNEDQESGYRANFESLTDEELKVLDPDIFCAGLLDRVARLRKAYEDEMATRKLKLRR
jgi:hypothetical protein